MDSYSRYGLETRYIVQVLIVMTSICTGCLLLDTFLPSPRVHIERELHRLRASVARQFATPRALPFCQRNLLVVQSLEIINPLRAESNRAARLFFIAAVLYRR